LFGKNQNLQKLLTVELEMKVSKFFYVLIEDVLILSCEAQLATLCVAFGIREGMDEN
jgi:hypothetical protein